MGIPSNWSGLAAGTPHQSVDPQDVQLWETCPHHSKSLPLAPPWCLSPSKYCWRRSCCGKHFPSILLYLIHLSHSPTTYPWSTPGSSLTHQIVSYLWDTVGPDYLVNVPAFCLQVHLVETASDTAVQVSIRKPSNHFLLFALFPGLISFDSCHFLHFLRTYLSRWYPGLISNHLSHFSSLISLIST